MKYNVGDRVRIKNFDWFRNEGANMVVAYMTKYYGEVVTIKSINNGFYRIKEDGGQYCWIDEMFECKMEEETKPELKFKVGDKVLIKSIDWYNMNKDKDGDIVCGEFAFLEGMKKFCSETLTILEVVDDGYLMLEDDHGYVWTDEMFEALVERNGKTYPYKIGDRVVLKGNNQCATITDLKCNSLGDLLYYIRIDNDRFSINYPTELLLPYKEPKFKVGDRVTVRGMSGIWEITNVEDDILYTIKRENHTFTLTTYGSFLTLYEGISDKKEEMKSKDELLDEYEELTDRAFKGGYEKCKSDILLNGYELPEGYIFKDHIGNEIHALKIVLEKANTLKTQSDNTLKTQNDNMEIETHRGYYTTEPETTNESKKVAWFTFWDNDFADKVELDLSNRELIQEDGKWFVVKKKKEYPKTYEECCEVLDIIDNRSVWHGYRSVQLKIFQKLLICRDAYWKIAGEEMGLGKPWKPDWSIYEHKFCLGTDKDKVIEECVTTGNRILAFPTEEMRDAFYENFKKEIEICKELL